MRNLLSSSNAVSPGHMLNWDLVNTAHLHDARTHPWLCAVQWLL